MRREDAIKTLRELWRETNDSWYEEVYNMAIEALEMQNLCAEMLESAQPVSTDWDLISRQAAIDALDQIFDRCEEIEAHLPEGDPDRTDYKMYPDYMTVWKYLHQLPSADRPTGEWKGYKADNPNWLRTDGTPIFLVCDKCNCMVMKFMEEHPNWVDESDSNKWRFTNMQTFFTNGSQESEVKE